jgi:hypothetical protein
MNDNSNHPNSFASGARQVGGTAHYAEHMAASNMTMSRDADPVHARRCALDTGARGWRWIVDTH